MTDYDYVVNVDGVVPRDDEYLLIERGADEDHAPGVLGLPGGKLEAPPGTDDAIEAAARRELAEEVGIEVGSVEYVCSGTFETGTGRQSLNVITRCEYTGGEPAPQDPEEVAAVHWLTREEIETRDDILAFTERDIQRAAATCKDD